MRTHVLSRRDLLKAGALVVGFNAFEPLTRVLAQGLQGGTPLSNAGGLPADQLDSWLAVAPDGTVTVPDKVGLGFDVDLDFVGALTETREYISRKTP